MSLEHLLLSRYPPVLSSSMLVRLLLLLLVHLLRSPILYSYKYIYIYKYTYVEIYIIPSSTSCSSSFSFSSSSTTTSGPAPLASSPSNQRTRVSQPPPRRHPQVMTPSESTGYFSRGQPRWKSTWDTSPPRTSCWTLLGTTSPPCGIKSRFQVLDL